LDYAEIRKLSIRIKTNTFWYWFFDAFSIDSTPNSTDAKAFTDSA
jgi:hypothetical protein